MCRPQPVSEPASGEIHVRSADQGCDLHEHSVQRAQRTSACRRTAAGRLSLWRTAQSTWPPLQSRTQPPAQRLGQGGGVAVRGAEVSHVGVPARRSIACACRSCTKGCPGAPSSPHQVQRGMCCFSTLWFAKAVGCMAPTDGILGAQRPQRRFAPQAQRAQVAQRAQRSAGAHRNQQRLQGRKWQGGKAW